MARLRNLVAHTHRELDFTSGELQKLCDNLKYVAHLVDESTGRSIFDEEQYRTTRNKFVFTVITLWNKILRTASETLHVA